MNDKAIIKIPAIQNRAKTKKKKKKEKKRKNDLQREIILIDNGCTHALARDEKEVVSEEEVGLG